MSVNKININKEVKEVEYLINQYIDSDNNTIKAASQYLLASGGKRIRPIFTIIAGEFGNNNIQDVRIVATTLELIHMASLVHDDVIDKSEKRRGKPTIAVKWDKETAILVGNYLLSQSLNAVSKVNNPIIHQKLSEGIIEVCRGELFQFQDQFKVNQSITNYLRRIKRKTALLITLATELGAYSANAEDITVKKLGRIGHYIGMSYQIIDDILDFTSNEKKLGKPVGSDLRNGNITLPVLLRMKNNNIFKQKIQSLNENSSDKLFEELIEEVINSEEITQSKKISDLYLEKAEALVNTLEKHDGQKRILGLIKKIKNRKH